jgi:acetyltransferase
MCDHSRAPQSGARSVPRCDALKQKPMTPESHVSSSPRGNAFARLAGLLEPRSVAVIGASDQPGNLGGRALTLLRKFGYPGEVWTVNPKRERVAGEPCYASVDILPATADLAIIAVSAEASLTVVRDCARAGIRNGIVWAGGFAEAGTEGVARQRALSQLCDESGFLLCGPNCLGVINAWQPLTATFASSLVSSDGLERGDISMVSQSGGTAMAVQTLAQQAGFGFRLMISSGNEAVLGVADYLEALVDDEHTAVIAVYLEGVRDGAALLAALARARHAGKPVVVLKAGVTREAGHAAAAHTGALVGDDRVWQAIFRDEAVIPVHSVRELTDVALLLSKGGSRKLPGGRGVAIVSFGGGGGVLGADQCARRGLSTPALSDATRERLRERVPPMASIANPVDVTPDAFRPGWLEHFPQALGAIADDPSIDALFFPLSAMAQGATDVAAAVVSLRERSAKPLCVSWMFAPADAVATLTRAGIVAFPDPARAIAALAHVAQYGAARRAIDAFAHPTGDAAGAQSLPFEWNAHVPNAVAGTIVTEDACHRILAEAGLPVARAGLAATADDAARIAASVGLPVAMKGISTAVTHRAVAGLLELDLRSNDEIRDAYGRLARRAGETGVELNGIYVQHMATGKLELLVSAFRDPVFGVMVACGAGGTLTEIIDDVTLERAPFDDARAAEVVGRLRIVQRADRIDRSARIAPVAAFVARFSQLVAGASWQRFVFEVNPIKWRGESVVAIDGLLIVEQP